MTVVTKMLLWMLLLSLGTLVFIGWIVYRIIDTRTNF